MEACGWRICIVDHATRSKKKGVSSSPYVQCIRYSRGSEVYREGSQRYPAPAPPLVILLSIRIRLYDVYYSWTSPFVRESPMWIESESEESARRMTTPSKRACAPAHTEPWVPPLPPHPTPPPNPSSDPSCRTRIELQPGFGQFIRQRPFRIQQLDVVGTADRDVVEQDVWNCVTACQGGKEGLDEGAVGWMGRGRRTEVSM
jgi:hypothetical protein